MTHPLRLVFRPSRYERGRLARTISLVYLALIALASVYCLFTVATADPTHPSFSVAPLLILTMPTSLVVAEPVAALSALVSSGGAFSAVALILSLALGGLLQAALVFLLLRGPRLDAQGRPAARAPRPTERNRR